MMKIEFELNKKRVLIFTLAIQLATFGIIGMNELGIKLFFLKQIVVFIYLVFIPGVLIIGNLKLLSKLSFVEMVLYAVGLSNSFLMIVGLIINDIYPIFGISKPISEPPLIITIGVCNLILWVSYLIRGEMFIKHFKINLGEPYLFLLLLPFFSIFGACFLTYYNNNIILLFMFAIISIIPILAVLKLPEDFYPVVLWVISISLLFQTSLVSTAVPNGGDATTEYYFSKLVLHNGIWKPSIPHNSNSMLRIVILHPVFSILLGMSLIWEYKIIHPLIFSLTPVALYLLYRKQTNSKIAFLGSCLFMFIFPFFTTLAMNTRTGMAIFYLVLIMLLIVNNNISKNIKIILYILFSFSLITSHYGTGWLFMLALPIIYILILIFKSHLNNKMKFSEFLSFELVAVYLTLAILWYSHTSRANIFRNFTWSMYIMLKNALVSLGFDVKTSYTVFVLVKEWAPTIEIIKYLFSIIILLSIIGIFNIVWGIIRLRRSYNFYAEYMFLSVLFLGMFLSTLLPQTRSAAPIRIYTLSMIFLSPFCVIGFIKFIKLIDVSIFKLTKQSIITKTTEKKQGEYYILLVFSVFLLILILFNSGFFSELFIKDYSPNILIHKKELTKKDIPPSEIDNRIITFYRWYFPECDVLSAMWLSERGKHTYRVYAQLAGLEGALNAYGSYQIRDQRFINFPTIPNIKPKERSYVYLRYLNYVQGIILSQIYPKIKWYSVKLLKLDVKGNKIYCNNGSAIYYLKPERC